MSPIDDKIISLTSDSALYFLITGLVLITSVETFEIIFFIGLILFLILGILTERSSWRYIKQYDNPYELIKKKNHPTLARIFLIVWIIFLILFFFSLSVPETQLYIKVPLLIISSSALILHTILRSVTTIKFKVVKDN